jgi:glycosyltransferase involved in cell wall biosynthesis
MPRLTATIITHNEAREIARAISSLRCADEIIVVDSGSTDATTSIARELGAKVVAHCWSGFAAQKNFATGLAGNDWILSLDADEELDVVAGESVLKWKASAPSFAGYRFARKAHYLGRWIRHSGWYPDYKLRLFDRRRGRWEGEYVHESVVVDGETTILPGEILHYTCDSLEEHRQRIEFYTDLAAAQFFAEGRRAGWLRRRIVPCWTFAQTYFLRAGFLDGRQGFWVAYMASRYVARKYAKAGNRK